MAGLRLSRRAAWGELALIAGLVLIQALLVLPLFSGEFTQHRGSIEATFIANAQFIVDHFPDLAWDPYWYLGFPFEWFYTPLLPALVAFVGKLGGDVPHAYRLVSAAGLAIGPAALFLAARELTRSRWVATIAAFAFIFVPSLSYALPNIYPDAHAFSGAIVPPPWRLVAMVEFGEGPHIASLSLALLAVAATIRYLRLPSAGRLAVAIALLVAVALTNLIGAFGAAILLLGIAASRHPSMPSEHRLARLFRVALLTSLFSAGWYSLGFVQHFAQPGGDDRASFYLALPVVAIIAVIAIRELSSPRLPAGADVVIGWLILFGLIVGLKQAFGLGIAPQPIRYAPELDAAFAVGLAIFVVGFADQLLRRYRPEGNRRFAVTVFCVLLFLAMGLPGWNAVRPKLVADEGWESWSERTVALWLRDHLGPGERAYLSGDHAFWLNVFAPDVAQVKGGQDFAAEDPWYAHAAFQINTGVDKDISLSWLRALPARFVVVTGPSSPDVYKDFVDPTKFDGLLPVVFDERGVRIYDVGAATAPLFGTVPAGGGTVVPVNGIDRDAIASYADDARTARPPVFFAMRGTSAWEATIDTPDAVDGWFRGSYDPGWRVHVDGRTIPTRADGIGELRFAIPAGAHSITSERRPRVDFFAGLVLALGTGLTLIWRRLRRETRAGRGSAVDRALSASLGTFIAARPFGRRP